MCIKTHLNNFFRQSTIIFFRDLCTIWCFIKNRWIVIDITNMYSNSRKILFTIISRLNFKFILDDEMRINSCMKQKEGEKNDTKLVMATYFILHTKNIVFMNENHVFSVHAYKVWYNFCVISTIKYIILWWTCHEWTMWVNVNVEMYKLNYIKFFSCVR